MNGRQAAAAVALSVCWGSGLAVGLHAQVASVVAPKTLTEYGITCTSGGSSVPGCPITLTISPVSNTNGHLHAGAPTGPGYHPASGLCIEPCTVNSQFTPSISTTSDANGNVYFGLYTTLVGQTEQLAFASSDQTLTLPAAETYMVGYFDLVFASNAAWVQVGSADTGGNTGHGGNSNNHWMTQATYNALQATTTLWSQRTGNCQICINDAALPNGGKFDINVILPYNGTAVPADPLYKPYEPWESPHQQHDRGSAVDINASGHQGCQSPVNIQQFITVCTQSGFQAASSFTEGDHPHCGTMSAASFPH